MTNSSFPLDRWPEKDRIAWERAISQGGILDERGPAAHWAEATRATNIHSYGRWLAFAAGQDGSFPTQDLVVRSTKDAVRRYIARLQGTTASKSVSSSIIGLTRMLMVMAPNEDWSWLSNISNKLKFTATPSRDKASRLLPSDEIYRVAIAKLQELNQSGLSQRADLVLFRNMLMLAILVPCPIRRKNFAALSRNETLRRLETGWRIVLSAPQIKNKEPTELDIPRSLTVYLDQYFTEVRPRFLRETDPGGMWLNWYGNTMTGHGVYLRLMDATTALFGRSLNPHLLRDCAATMLVTDSPDDAMAAKGLLGHRDFRTTKKHYVHAKQLEASRTINSFLRDLAKNR